MLGARRAAGSNGLKRSNPGAQKRAAPMIAAKQAAGAVPGGSAAVALAGRSAARARANGGVIMMAHQTTMRTELAASGKKHRIRMTSRAAGRGLVASNKTTSARLTIQNFPTHRSGLGGSHSVMGRAVAAVAVCDTKRYAPQPYGLTKVAAQAASAQSHQHHTRGRRSPSGQASHVTPAAKPPTRI